MIHLAIDLPMPTSRAPLRLRPMLAVSEPAGLTDARLVYEPKYDGIRALVDIEPPRRKSESARVTIWSRNGNDKTLQFPDLVPALATLVARRKTALLLDGEIVALDAAGRPTSFLSLQPRIHRTTLRETDRAVRDRPVVYIAFDLLEEGGTDLRKLPFAERRLRLQKRFGRSHRARVWLSECVPADARDLYRRARQEGWEGLIAKEVGSPYQAGRRSPPGARSNCGEVRNSWSAAGPSRANRGSTSGRSSWASMILMTRMILTPTPTAPSATPGMSAAASPTPSSRAGRATGAVAE